MSSNTFMDSFLNSKYASDAVSPAAALQGYSHQHRMYPYGSLSPQSSVAVSGTLYYTSNAADLAKSCRYNSTGAGNGLDISGSGYAFNLQNCGVAGPGSMMTPAQFLTHPASDLASTLSPCSQLGYRQLDPLPDVPRYPWMSIAGKMLIFFTFSFWLCIENLALFLLLLNVLYCEEKPNCSRTLSNVTIRKEYVNSKGGRNWREEFLHRCLWCL